MAYNDSRNPLRALQKKLGEEITVRLKDGVEYRGKLKEYDGYMNLILLECQEFYNKQESARHNELFIRGNNILFVIP
jgi:small nuclear ribonucleoprotein (snRNP)-like protein